MRNSKSVRQSLLHVVPVIRAERGDRQAVGTEKASGDEALECIPDSHRFGNLVRGDFYGVVSGDFRFGRVEYPVCTCQFETCRLIPVGIETHAEPVERDYGLSVTEFRFPVYRSRTGQFREPVVLRQGYVCEPFAGGLLVAMEMEPIRVRKVIGAKKMWKSANGYVFVNFSDDGELELSYRSADGGYVMIDRSHATAAIIKSKIAGGENIIYLPNTAPRALAETVRMLGGIVKRYDIQTESDSDLLAGASGQTWQNDPILLALLYAAELGDDRRILYAGEEFALAEKTLTVENAAAVLGELAAHGADTENGMVVLNFDDASVRVTAQSEHTVKLSAEAKTSDGAEDALRYAEKGISESVHPL